MDPPRSYDPAFAEDDANIVLRSSDAVYYRVPSYTLRTTSEFFRGMMTLPQTEDKWSDLNSEELIVLDESSKVLGKLLRLIGGLEIPQWDSLDDVRDVLAAAEKYEMPGPIAIIRSAITSPFFLQHPLELYALATHYGWEEEAKLASTHSLRLCIYDDVYHPLLERIPTSYLLRLQRLHRTRRDEFWRLININRLGVQYCIQCNSVLEPKSGAGPWHLMNRMLWEMDRRPAGDTLLDGLWLTWPEYTWNRICLSNACHVSMVTSAKYQYAIAQSVKTAINSLTSTI